MGGRWILVLAGEGRRVLRYLDREVDREEAARLQNAEEDALAYLPDSAFEEEIGADQGTS